MLNITDLIGFGSGLQDKYPVTTTFISSLPSTTNGNSYTFSAVSIGSATKTNRKIFAFATGDGNATGQVTGITFAGSAMTFVGRAELGQNENSAWVISNTSETAPTFVVSWAATKGRMALHIFVVESNDSLDIVDTLSTTNTTGTVSGGIDFKDKGAVLAVAYFRASTATVAWTNITEDTDLGIESSSRYSAAHITPTADELNKTITAIGGGAEQTLVGVSIR